MTQQIFLNGTLISKFAKVKKKKRVSDFRPSIIFIFISIYIFIEIELKCGTIGATSASTVSTGY